jgi:hypothetical protein
MTDLSTYFAKLLPDGWRISNIISLDPEWQANITDGEWVAVSTGDTMEAAVCAAGAKALAGSYIGRLFDLGAPRAIEPTEAQALLATLGLKIALPEPIKRRV